MNAVEYAAATGQSVEDAERQIEERVMIAWGVDAQECESCGTPLPDGVASDPTWHMDSVMNGRDDTGEPIILAEIRCPKCW